MNRILFLDDNPARHRWARRELGVGNDLTIVDSVSSATSHLDPGDCYDTVYLDHDLTEETFVDSSRPDCGMAVVRWIVENRPRIGEVIVHTMNTPAGHAMVRALKMAGYRAKYRSFYKMAHED